MTSFTKTHPAIRNERGALIDKFFIGMIIAVFVFTATAAAIVMPLI